MKKRRCPSSAFSKRCLCIGLSTSREVRFPQGTRLSIDDSVLVCGPETRSIVFNRRDSSQESCMIRENGKEVYRYLALGSRKYSVKPRLVSPHSRYQHHYHLMRSDLSLQSRRCYIFWLDGIMKIEQQVDTHSTPAWLAWQRTVHVKK
jgi:hypothetical protein